MTLVLKSDGVFTGQEIAAGFKDYQARVLADGGELQSRDATISALMFAKSSAITAINCFSATSVYFGIKKSGANITKLYSLFGASGDLVVDRGEFPLQESSGVLGVFHNTSSTNSMRTFGTSQNPNLGVITAYRPANPPTTQKYIAGIADHTGVSTELALRLNQGGTVLGGYYNGTKASLSTEITQDANMMVSGVVYDGAKASLLAFDEVKATAATTPVAVPANGFTMYSGAFNKAASGAFAGWITETWGMSGASVETVQKIGARMKGLYQGK